jgi:hypothetical protein
MNRTRPIRSLLPAICAEQYRSGLTVTAVASLHGVPFSTMYLHLLRLGVPMRKQGLPAGRVLPDSHPVRKIPLAQIPALLADVTAGKSLEETGRKYGITRARVLQIAQAHGLKGRRAA